MKKPRIPASVPESVGLSSLTAADLFLKSCDDSCHPGERKIEK